MQYLGASIVVLNSCLRHLYLIRASVQIPAAPFPIQLTGNAPRKAMEDGPNTWALTTHITDPNGIPGSWLQSGLASAPVVI